MKRLKKSYRKFYVFLGQPMHGAIEEYISSCYMKKCLGGGGGGLCYVALSEDEMVVLNLVLNFSIKHSW
jgi:tetrahydromethanopterin S-methyltransferase subunit D